MRGGQGNTETYFQVPIQAGSMLVHAMSVIPTDPADLNGFYLFGLLRNGPLRGRCYYLTGLYLLFICPTCLVIALELQ